MGLICFLLGVAFGCTVTSICVKRYMFNAWYLKGQEDLIEAMKIRNRKSGVVVKDLYTPKKGE